MFSDGHGHSHGPGGHSHENMMQKAFLQMLAKNNGQLPAFPPNMPQQMKEMALKFYEKNKALLEQQAIPLSCTANDSNSDVNCNPLLMAKAPSTSDQPKLTKEQEDAKIQAAIESKDFSKLDIIKATQYGIIERCKELIESGQVDVNQPDQENVYLLHWAAINNRVDLAKYFIEKGAQIDPIGGTLESTPLHWAARSGNISMVVFLINAGANPLLYDNEGFSTIHLASMFGHTSIVAFLLAKGVDADMPDKINATALMYAAQRIHNRDPAQLLITFNARLNAQDINGNTPLHYCVQFNNSIVMRSLLDKGASLEIKNNKNLTPFELAIERKKQNIVFMLSSYANDNKTYVPKIFHPLSTNKDIRRLVTRAFPFFTLFYFGSILETSMMSIAVKLLFIVGFYAIYVAFSTLFFDKYLSKYLPISTTFSIIFWLYTTWFIYLRPLVFDFSLYSLLFFLATYLSWFNFYKAWKTNPGILTNNKREEISKNILRYIEKNEFSLDQFCTSCVVRKPLRSKHCSECDHCVSKFDHHCPWVDNCIGQYNLKYFIGFVVFTPICLMFFMHGSITYFITYGINKNESSSIAAFWYFISYSPWVTFFTVVAGFNLFWISMLGICHLYQALYLAMTTNERMNLHRYSHFKDKNNRFYNPFNFGILGNAADVFELKWSFLKPRKIDWIKEYDVEELIDSNRIKRSKYDDFNV